jgi:hypothetical protein
LNVSREADGADDLVEPVVVGQVVEHQVAMGDAERGVHPRGRGHHVVANIAEFGQRFWLGVGEQQGVELGRLVPALQEEVDAVG